MGMTKRMTTLVLVSSILAARFAGPIADVGAGGKGFRRRENTLFVEHGGDVFAGGGGDGNGFGHVAVLIKYAGSLYGRRAERQRRNLAVFILPTTKQSSDIYCYVKRNCPQGTGRSVMLLGVGSFARVGPDMARDQSGGIAA